MNADRPPAPSAVLLRRPHAPSSGARLTRRSLLAPGAARCCGAAGPKLARAGCGPSPAAVVRGRPWQRLQLSCARCGAARRAPRARLPGFCYGPGRSRLPASCSLRSDAGWLPAFRAPGAWAPPHTVAGGSCAATAPLAPAIPTAATGDGAARTARAGGAGLSSASSNSSTLHVMMPCC